MAETADIIVIGAGVQGASLAFHLARRGSRPLVVERGAVAAGATGRSSGLVRMHYDLMSDARLALASLPWFEAWDELVGAGACGFTVTGFVQLVGPEKADRLRANVADLRRVGVVTEVVDAQRIRDLIPALDVADGELGAWEPGSGYADPTATAAGFLRGAMNAGARLIQGAEVTAIPTDGGRVAGVDTTKGAFRAPIVIIAAGGWARRVAALAGVALPISVWRHDVAYLGEAPRIAIPFPAVIDDVNAMYFRPEGRELILVGLEDHTASDGSPDRETWSVEPGFDERAAQRIVRRMPAVAEGSFRAAHSGQDGLTADERPILGPVGQDGPDGLWLDCGHSGTGFKTSPAVGLSLAEWILDGEPRTVDIRPYAFGRFAAGRLLRGEHAYGNIWR
jgi:sarcosine oxidase subunit beta